MKTINLRGFAAALLLTALTIMPAPAASPAASPVTLVPAETTVDAGLANLLLGTWWADDIKENGSLSIERTYLRNGRFMSTTAFHPAVDRIATSEMARPQNAEGKWRIEQDVLIEEIERSIPPIEPAAQTSRRRVRVEGPDHIHLLPVEGSGAEIVLYRKPLTTATHVRAVLAPVPEPGTPGDWIVFDQDRMNVSHYDKSTITRNGDFVAVWTRSRLTPAGLEKSRELAAATPQEANRILEVGELRRIIDCRLRLVKNRQIRIHFGGGEQLTSNYLTESPLEWDRIRAQFDDATVLAGQVCPVSATTGR